MQKIILGVGQGKTSRLIHIAAEQMLTIVCLHEAERRKVKEEAIDFNLDIRPPITFDEFLDKSFMRIHKKEFNGFLIDNADILLSKMSEVPIIAITVSP